MRLGLGLRLGIGLWLGLGLASFVTPSFNFNTAINCEGFSTFSSNVSIWSRPGLEVRLGLLRARARVRVRIRVRVRVRSTDSLDLFRELFDDAVDRSSGVVVN